MSEDGEVTDQFATGGVITGIAATIGPDRLLFIAGEKTLTGWKVE